MKTLKDLGEFGVIDRIQRAAARSGVSRGVVLGIGDDAALLRVRPDEDVVVTSDSLVEGVHFRWQYQAPNGIGRRALVANLSDLAAMGARPLGFTWALSAPPELPVAVLDSLLRGMLSVSLEESCPLVGGNITRASETVLAITAIGAVRRGKALKRSAARVGDRIFVTGNFGGAALATARAEAGRGKIRHRPAARLGAGQKLTGLPGIGACIDVSDGLLADLQHLLDASQVGAELELASVPTPRGFSKHCQELGLDPQTLALSGGEDYELLFTCRGKQASAKGISKRLGLSVQELGRIVPKDQSVMNEPPEGWRHF